MARKAPNRAHRVGINQRDAHAMFATESQAEQWFIDVLFDGQLHCPRCVSDNVAIIKNRKPMPFRCRSCRKHFSVKHGTFMQNSNISLADWAITFYYIITNLKGVSSLKLHRDLGITQKSAWFMLHRIRLALKIDEDVEQFDGEVEVDESYFGGNRTKMNAATRRRFHEKHGAGRGTTGKTAVVGIRQRGTKRIRAKVVEKADKSTLQSFVLKHTTQNATIYTDEAAAYIGLPRNHAAVNHGIGEYVSGKASTNGVESFWSAMQRGLVGVYHNISPKHLQRYVDEYSGKAEIRDMDTEMQMAAMARNGVGKRLRYKDLIAD